MCVAAVPELASLRDRQGNHLGAASDYRLGTMEIRHLKRAVVRIKAQVH